MPHRLNETKPTAWAWSLALAATALVALLLASCGSSHHHSTSSSTTPSTSSTSTLPAKTAQITSRPVSDLETIFEPGAELMNDPTTTLDALRELGVDRVKLYVPWSAVAPDSSSPTAPPGFNASDPNAYSSASWAPYDTVLRLARARNMGIDLTLGGAAPIWATTPGQPPGPTGIWKPSAADFGAFVHATALRYSGHFTPAGDSSPLPRVTFWSFWNEPNYGQYLAPQAIDNTKVEVAPALYRHLLDAAWSALQATGHGHDTILFGELAPRGQTLGNHPGNYDGMVPLRFLRALYCVDSSLHPLQGQAASLRDCPSTPAASKAFPQENPILFRASGLALHPYPVNQPPTFVNPIEPDYADFGSLPKVEHLLDAMQQAYGSATKLPLYPTEYGYHTSPPESSYRAVPVDTAARWLNEAEYLSWIDPRIRAYDQYLLTDPPGSGNLFATGLETWQGLAKPTLDAYRLPIFLPVPHAGPGQPVTVWGCVRTVTYLKRPQRAAIQFATHTRGPWHTVKRLEVADPHGYFQVPVTFSASGYVRLVWRDPGGHLYSSRLAAVSIG